MAYLVIYDVPYDGSKVEICETREDVEKYAKTIGDYARSQSEIEVYTISSVADLAVFLAPTEDRR